MKIAKKAVPVAHPLLPTADALLPYLRRIDASGWYSNHGPLERELRQRLAERYGLDSAAVVSASSGTAGLAGVLMALSLDDPARSHVVVPDFTFVATGLAVLNAGFVPLIAAVEKDSWQLDPADLAARDLSSVAAVLVVSPFGRAIDQQGWHEFSEQTGVPVLVDAAAGIETLLSAEGDQVAPRLPTVVSLHATKAIGVGEGGFILCPGPEEAAAVESRLNFGFVNGRLSEVAGFNGKLSEYHCAVGLASLDALPETLAAHRRVVAVYRDALEPAVLERLVTAPTVSSCYALLEATTTEENDAWATHLLDQSVETRTWYGHGLSSQPVFADSPRLGPAGPVPAVLGLPMSPRFDDKTVCRVAAAVTSAVGATC